MSLISPLTDVKPYCRVVENFLSAAECAALKNRIGETAGANSDYPPSYRNNHRIVFDDATLAAELAARMQAALGCELAIPEAEFVGINPRWRGCRYQSGERFNIHQDGVFHANARTRSRLTFMLYLDDAENFIGGDTLFFADGPGTAGAQIEIGRYRPQLGALIVFSHPLWHAGDLVLAGSKTILRSDLLYRDQHATHGNDHQGYVFCVAQLDAQTHASGGRDGTVRLWQNGCNVATLNAATQSILKIAALGTQHLVAISRDRSVSIWHWRNQTLVARMQSCFPATPLAIIALDAVNFLVSDATGTISQFSLCNENLKCTQRSTLHAGWAWAMCQLPTGEFASVSEDGAILIFDAKLRRISQLHMHTPMRALTASNDATLYAADTIGQIHQLQLQGGILIKTQCWQAHTAAVRCLHLDARGQLWSGAEDNQLRVWQVFANLKPTLAAHYVLAGFVTDVLVTNNIAWVASYAGHLGVEICAGLEDSTLESTSAEHKKKAITTAMTTNDSVLFFSLR